jgi:hypothetical protein
MKEELFDFTQECEAMLNPGAGLSGPIRTVCNQGEEDSATEFAMTS